MNLRAELESRLAEALAAAGAPAGSPALILPAARAEFGDYQANGVMAAAKQLKINPRELATRVVAAAKMDDIAEGLTIAGPGFINIRIRSEFLAARLGAIADDQRLGIAQPLQPQTVVVDYSGPNLAKEMHVGHLRSTIIGDALARVLELLGHRVIRQNHVGDWGTQFGMLTAFLDMLNRKAELDAGKQGAIHGTVARLEDLEEFYRQAKKFYDENENFAKLAREYVVKLQGGDRAVHESWVRFRSLSLQHCNEVYVRLGVSLSGRDVRGESAYNADLPKVIDELEKNPAVDCRVSEGALCVFLDEFKGKDGSPLPVIVRKSDGGYLYATTDLAAIRCRVGELQAGRVLYVTDSRQALHFAQIFAVARKAGFAPAGVSLEHVPFGTMMGADNKPFKTRTGGTVKLMDLLDEAETRAAELLRQKNPELAADGETLANVARVVGVGAVKYADLAHNRNSDYVFSWEKMLALDGNTAPYMQYAYARIRSIFRKGAGTGGAGTGDWGLGTGQQRASGEQDVGIADQHTSRERKRAEDVGAITAARISVEHASERALAMKLAAFGETVDTVAAECLPHLLCNYLYDLAGAFMAFYENCPVLQAESDDLRRSRLALCDLAARTIQTGLALLGIDTLEQM